MTPDWMSGSLRLNDALAITYNRLYIVIFTLIVFSLILAGLEAHPTRSRHPGRFAESRHGQGDGHPHRVGGCDDIRARLGYRRCGGRGAQPVDQRRSRIWGSPTSSIRSWWWCSAASEIFGAH